MVSAQGLFYQPKKSLELMRKEDIGPHVVQIFGADPKMMADMARKYCMNFDIIDINMGCPAPKIVKGGAGCTLMKTPDTAFDIVKAVRGATGKPVTCKIRSGWDRENTNAIEFAKGLETAGAALITLHARTREQYYSGEADWGLIKRLKDSVSIPVVGNGDIKCAGDAARMMELTGCDAAMVGRAAQGKPYIFQQIKTYLETGSVPDRPSFSRRMQDALEHAQGLCAIFGEKNAARMMRKHLAWYIKGERDAANLRNLAVKVASLGDIEGFIREAIRSSSINT